MVAVNLRQSRVDSGDGHPNSDHVLQQNWRLNGSPFLRSPASWITLAKRLGFWLNVIRITGLLIFLDRYAEANKGSHQARQVPGSMKRLIWVIRGRAHDCCGQKVQYFLAREWGIHLSVPKI